MTSKKTILIFGISSFLGSSIAARLRGKYRIVGTYYNTPVNIPGVLTIKCDVHEKHMVERVTGLFKPDITIYCVGLRDHNVCQDHPKLADALNTVGVFNVSQASERYHSKFIYFSSCYIFSGEDIMYRENDTPMPSSIYGNTAASAEFYIQKSCLNYVIFRCAPIFGRSLNPNDLTFVEAIEREEFRGNKVSCDNKVHTGFVDVNTICETLTKAIEKNVTNRLLQISSKDIMTHYDFAKLFLEKVGGNTAVLSKGDWKFPRTENLLALQSVGEEMKFHMDIFNAQAELKIKFDSVDGMIENYLMGIRGLISTKAKASGNVTFI